jgi:predicted DNA-binding transcriptional regulator AlpA
MKEPDFPKKVQLSRQSIGFLEKDVQQWIEDKKVS